MALADSKTCELHKIVQESLKKGAAGRTQEFLMSKETAFLLSMWHHNLKAKAPGQRQQQCIVFILMLCHFQALFSITVIRVVTQFISKSLLCYLETKKPLLQQDTHHPMGLLTKQFVDQ